MTPRLVAQPAETAAQRLAREAHEAELGGALEEARSGFELALRALTPGDEETLAASLFRWIAWTHANAGDAEAALDCLEAAEAAAVATGDDRALASVLNTRAATLFQLGELDEAEPLLWRVRSLAWEVGDRKLQAIVDQNLGSIASIRGDLPLALRRFRSSLAAYEELGELEYVGPLLNNIGRLQIDLGDDAGAARTLARARRHCLERGDRHHRIMIEVNRARLQLKAGRPALAASAAEEARGLVEETGDDRWIADIDLMSGAAQARLGRTDVALELLGRAAEVAGARRDAKVLADVMFEQATVYHSEGKNRETLQSLNEAHRIFHKLKARRELADVDTRIAELEAVFLRFVREWGESIDSKDAYTQGHCSRVADYACALAVASGLPEEELSWFRMGALLHDVGKVVVPLEILNKEGPLDDREFRVMASHPVVGVDLLADIEFPWDVRPMIRHHHERLDGSGYPDGLAGDEIPLAARILTVADVYDALTTDRSYRAAFSHDEALEVMEEEAGRTLDPHLFALFRGQVISEPAGAEHPPVVQLKAV